MYIISIDIYSRMSTKTRIPPNDRVRVSFVSPKTKGNKEDHATEDTISTTVIRARKRCRKGFEESQPINGTA